MKRNILNTLSIKRKINEMKKRKEGEENENNNERFYGVTDGRNDRGGNGSYTQRGKEGYLLQDPKDLSSDKGIQNSKDNEENQKGDRCESDLEGRGKRKENFRQKN